uniref:Uncharacterized protein n=1 Tax=Oryza brachyantha TaxID=4533 RepID=J3MSY7_ORYBR
MAATDTELIARLLRQNVPPCMNQAPAITKQGTLKIILCYLAVASVLIGQELFNEYLQNYSFTLPMFSSYSTWIVYICL